MFIFLMVLVCLFSFTALWAQEKKAEAKPEAADPKEMVGFSKQVELFIQLVAVGEARKDSLILMSAVRLLDAFPFDGIAKPGTNEKSKTVYNRDDLLKEAKEFAQGDAEVLAMVAKLQEVPKTTAVRGFHDGHIGPPRGRDLYDGPPGFIGPGSYHRGYHGGGYRHHRRHHCVWFQVCSYWGCEWVCR